MSSVASVSSAAGVQAAAQSLGDNKGLDKSAFLKLLVAQLKNQDPLKPQDDTQFVAQLAQFSNLEQVMGINSRLDALTLQGRGMQNTQIAALVGSTVTVNGSKLGLDGSGVGVPVVFSQASASADTTVSIMDGAGTVIRSWDAGAKPAGLVKTVWDGKSDAGVPQPPGVYTVSVRAKGAGDVPVSVTLDSTSRVASVSFAKGYPELGLENGLSVPVSDLLRVQSATTTTTTP